jgi:hypothetical protein
MVLTKGCHQSVCSLPKLSVLQRMECCNIYMSVSLHTTLSFSTSPCILLNFPFHFSNNLTNTSLFQRILSLSATDTLMQEVHFTRDDHLELRESSPTQHLWVIVAILCCCCKTQRLCCCCKTLRSRFFVNFIGHLPLQVSKSAELWPAKKR